MNMIHTEDWLSFSSNDAPMLRHLTSAGFVANLPVERGSSQRRLRLTDLGYKYLAVLND